MDIPELKPLIAGVTLIEFLTTFVSFTIFSLRFQVGLIPSILFGFQCIHLISPFTSFAAIAVDDNKYAIQGANVLYCFVLLVDLIGIFLTLFYPYGFKGEIYWWVLTVGLSYFVFDIINILLLTGYNKVVSANLRVGQQQVLKEQGSEYLAKQNVWLPSRRVFKLKRILARTWKIGLVVYLLYMTAAIIENIFSLRMTWILIASIPYLWSWPFVNVLVGPGGESGQDPEPWVKNRPSGVNTITYMLIWTGICGLCASIAGTAWYWPKSTLSVVLSSITISFLSLLVLFHIWTMIQMARLDAAISKSQKFKTP